MLSKSESDKVGLTLCRIILIAAAVIELDVSGLMLDGTVKSTLVILFLIASAFCWSVWANVTFNFLLAVFAPTVIVACNYYTVFQVVK